MFWNTNYSIHSFINILQWIVTPSPEQIPFSKSTEQVPDFPNLGKKLLPGQHLRFETISLEDGLSQSTVFCIIQDSQGFMWFGTEED